MTLKNEDLQEHTKRLRFKSLTNVQHCSGDSIDKSNKENRSKGIYGRLLLVYFVSFTSVKWTLPDSCISFLPDGVKSASLLAFLHVELTRGYLLEHDEERFSARREKVYSFFKIPQELEKFMVYGFFQCADSMLFVYTFLPLRFVMAFWSFIDRLFRKCFG